MDGEDRFFQRAEEDRLFGAGLVYSSVDENRTGEALAYSSVKGTLQLRPLPHPTGPPGRTPLTRGRAGPGATAPRRAARLLAAADSDGASVAAGPPRAGSPPGGWEPAGPRRTESGGIVGGGG